MSESRPDRSRAADAEDAAAPRERTCPTWRSSPACPAPAGAPRPTCSRTSAGSSSTTCRRRCCRRSPSSAAGRAATSRGSRPSSTSAAGRSSPTCTAALAAARRRRQRPADRVPGGVRRRARPPARGGPPAAPAAGRRPARSTASPRERELLRDLRGEADLVLDTTDLNVHELRAKVLAAFERRREPGLHATVMSFGYKYGLPVDADLVVDCRFLPNPHWVPELRPLTGPRRAGPRLRDGQPGATSSSTRTRELLDAHRAGLPAGGQALRRPSPSAAPAASTAASRWPRSWPARLRARRRRRRRRPPRPGARVSVPDAPGRAGGRRARWRARAGRVAAGAAPGHRPAHGRRHASPTTAGRAAGCAASSASCRRATCGWRWPRCAATTTGAAPGATSCSTGSAARASCTTTRVGNLLIVALWELLGDPVDGPRLGGPAARRRRAGCCRCPPCRSRSRPTSSTGRTAGVERVVRGQVAVATDPGPGASASRCVPPDAAGVPRGGGGGARRRLGGARPGLVVHQRAPAPAGARPAPPRCSDTSARRLRRAQPARRSRGRPTASRRRPTSRCWPRTHRTCELDVVLADTDVVSDRRRRWRRPRPRWAPSWCSRRWLVADRPDQHDPDRLAAAFRRLVSPDDRPE